MRVVSTNIRMVDSWPFMKSLKFQLDSLIFFWNGFVYPKIRNPKFDSAMVFEEKKNQAPVLVPKIRLNSDSE